MLAIVESSSVIRYIHMHIYIYIYIYYTWSNGVLWW